MPFQRLLKVRHRIKPQGKHCFFTKLHLVVTILWAAVSILLVFMAVYLAFKGNFR